MTESVARIGRIALISAMVVASGSCQENRPTPTQVTAKFHQQIGFPTTLRIEILSSADDPVCIPAAEISNGYDNFKITQNNQQLFSDENANRAIRMWKSINSLDQIYIVLKGKTKFWYELDTFPLRASPFTVQANIKAVRCADLFVSDDPHWFSIPAEGTFNFVPSDK